MDNKKWIEVWTKNYNNETENARDIDRLMKTNYKNHKYVPWAVMQRNLFMMDENAEIESLTNEKGGLVWTDTVSIEQETEENGKISVTKLLKHSHFVKIRILFLGKTHIETYPIQDNSYSAPNFYDSNMVNKSIQRGKTRGIAAVTGLGYQLYETGDLQFEDDGVSVGKKDIRTIQKKVTSEAPTRTKEVVEEPEVVKESKVDDSDAYDLAKYIKDNADTIDMTLQSINPSLIKAYKRSIKTDMSIDEIAEVVSLVSNVKVFSNSLKTRHEQNIK